MPESKLIELIGQLTRAKSLQQICDLAYHITGNPIFIGDLAHTILAYTKCVEVADEAWNTHIVNAILDRNTLNQDREVDHVHHISKDENRPVLVQDDFIPYPRIIKSLVQDHRQVGVLVLTAFLKPFGEQDMDLVDLISAFVIPHLLREHYHLSDRKHTVNNFFIKLLDGENFSKEQIAKRLNILKFQQKPYTYVLTMGNDNTSSHYVKEKLSQICMRFSSALRCPVFIYNTVLVCVYGSSHPVNHWPKEVPELAQLLDNFGLICGISWRLTSFEQLSDRYLQARAALEKGHQLERKERFLRYDLLSFYLLVDKQPICDLDNYCHEQIQALGEYDRKYGTDLCTTLQVYLEQAKNVTKTSEILFIHRNTVRYRIQRCMELLDNQLENGNEIFTYILSLRILEYHYKFGADRSNTPIRNDLLELLPAEGKHHGHQ